MISLKRYKILLIVVGTIILIFSLSFIRNFDNSRVTDDSFQPFLEMEQVIEKEVETEVGQNKIVVDIKGAVNNPGVYVMEPGDRIVDVIERANGFQKEANQELINLALLLEDEMMILVPIQGQEGLETGQLTITSSKDNGKININKATAEQLEKIPGIGPVKAAAIILFREEHGAFKSIEDIVQVSGIGQKSIEKIDEFIEVK